MTRRPHHARSDGERGLVLIPVLLIAMLLGGLAMGLVEEGMGERTAVKHHIANMLALEICEVGLVRSELEIATNTDRDGGGIGNVEGEVHGGSYRVEATKVPGGLDRWVLFARGEHGLSVRRVEVGLKLRGGLFAYALFGKDLVKIQGGGSTDSYDSRLGDHASQAVNADALGPYAKTNGTVGSNLDIEIANNTAIRGHAHPGPTGSFTGPVANVYGNVSNLSEPADLPPPPLDEYLAVMATNDNGKIDGTLPGVTYDPATYSLRLDAGGTLVLDGGTYFFTHVVVEGNAELRVTAQTTIYATGYMSFRGGMLTNMTNVPANLVIYSHPYDIVPGVDILWQPKGKTDASNPIYMEGSSASAFAMYAPERNVRVGGGADMLGSIVGRTVDLTGGSAFHYDEALSDWGYGENRLGTRLYWVELGGHNH